jgi:mannose-6-phosphate isomerase-like protein (cupin superfamily)
MDPSSGAVRVRAESLDATIVFLEGLGFRLEEIAPADDPSEAWMTGHGLRLRLDRATREGLELMIPVTDTLPAGKHVGPAGVVVEVTAPGALHVPPPGPAFVQTRLAESPFHPGRAGLLYRDLLPSRLGGRWIASHIRAATGGPVDDRVHHHRVRLQLIYCLSGEAQLVYQEQGPPFAFRAGDLVLQPPGLRHRVLSASAGFEVVEVASPAWHPTLIDHDTVLPSQESVPDLARQGQRFLHAVADRSSLRLLTTGVSELDLGLQDPSGGLASARAVRFDRAGTVELRDADDLHFLFVSAGRGAIDGPRTATLAAGDALALPSGRFVLTGAPGLQVLEVTSPG